MARGWSGRIIILTFLLGIELAIAGSRCPIASRALHHQHPSVVRVCPLLSRPALEHRIQSLLQVLTDLRWYRNGLSPVASTDR